MSHHRLSPHCASLVWQGGEALFRDAAAQGILTGGGGGKRVRWPDEEAAAGTAALAAFSVGGASREQVPGLRGLQPLHRPR